MNLRAALPADAPAIAAIEAAATPLPWSAAQVAASLDAGAAAWVLEDDGRIVGHLLASAQGPEGEVLIVAVHPDRQRRGGARRLLAEALAFWRARGVEKAFLEVREDNTAGRALYAACGWVEAGRRRRYYRDGTDAIVLTRDPRAPTG